MYIVTNRNIQTNQSPENRFGNDFNEKGPAELRLAEAEKSNNSWNINILEDEVVHENQTMAASEAAFLKLQKKLCNESTNCLIFCHGFNTNFASALEAAYRLQEIYKLEVVLFTWPSDGRLQNYRDDKREAIQSIYAFDRCLEKMNGYLSKYKDRNCQRKFSIALHSMGVYIFKHLMKSTIYQGETLLFDNIIFLSADVNSAEHAEWCDRIRFRNRLFITINEDDRALAASSAKGGSEQLTRLGHSIQNLLSANATYLNFTDAEHVGNAHNYFSKSSPLQNAKVKSTFQVAFNGGRAELDLDFDIGTGAYKID